MSNNHRQTIGQCLDRINLRQKWCWPLVNTTDSIQQLCAWSRPGFTNPRSGPLPPKSHWLVLGPLPPTLCKTWSKSVHNWLSHTANCHLLYDLLLTKNLRLRSRITRLQTNAKILPVPPLMPTVSENFHQNMFLFFSLSSTWWRDQHRMIVITTHTGMQQSINARCIKHTLVIFFACSLICWYMFGVPRRSAADIGLVNLWGDLQHNRHECNYKDFNPRASIVLYYSLILSYYYRMSPNNNSVNSCDQWQSCNCPVHQVVFLGFNWPQIKLHHKQQSDNKKSELMLTRRARGYGSSCSQVILVHLHPFRRNSLFCSQKSPKITQNQYFGGSRSFKVIDVDISKKLVVSPCYNKQHVCAYMQPFTR